MTDRNKSIALLAAAVLLGCISIVVCLAVTLTSGVLSPQPATTSSAAGGPGNLYVEYILDASYSMNDPLSDGKKKVDAARERLSHSLKAYPPEVNLGLRVYGHRIPYLGREQESCTDIEQVAPAAPGYQGEIVTWLRDFEAQGMTPIGIALYQASKDLSQEPGKVNSIVLISDGQETCGVDPCLMVEKLRSSGFRITVYVIGLKVDDPTRQQLTCIARTGGGVYQDVQSDVELQQALDQVQTEIEKIEVVAVAPTMTSLPIAPQPPTPLPSNPQPPTPIPSLTSTFVPAATLTSTVTPSATATVIIPPLSLDAIKNATYEIEGTTYTLVNGGNIEPDPADPEFNIMVYLSRDYEQQGIFAPGDLNGDNTPDTVAVLARNYGGSAFDFYLVVIYNESSVPRPLPAIYIGYRGTTLENVVIEQPGTLSAWINQVLLQEGGKESLRVKWVFSVSRDHLIKISEEILEQGPW